MQPPPTYLKQFEGFFIPQEYKIQYAYRTRAVFRITFLLAIVTVLTVAATIFLHFRADQVKTLTIQTQQTIQQDTSQLALQKATLQAFTDKYNDLQKLREHLRIPLAPILDSVEKTIPDPISITKISFLCPPIPTTATASRKATLTLEVFFPESTQPNDAAYTNWPKTISQFLQPHGIQVASNEWSPIRHYTPSLATKIEQKDRPTQKVSGKSKDLTLVLQLPKS